MATACKTSAVMARVGEAQPDDQQKDRGVGSECHSRDFNGHSKFIEGPDSTPDGRHDADKVLESPW